MSKGELWNILPYVGLWDQSPRCGPLINLKTPEVNKVNLVGIPFTGDNTGANPDLRLISFYADTLDGPISTTGPRSTFFRDYLNYKISWKIERFAKSDDELADKSEGVQIGFYTQAYTLDNPGPNNMLLILEENGPALYKANECNRYRGCFITTDVNDLFVVVNANVVVKLKITSSLPNESEIPCFTELFKPYEYLSKCGKLMATQFLVNTETGQTLLRPVKKYIKTSKKIIYHLFATSVNIILFETPTINNNILSKKAAAEFGRLVQLFPYGNVKEEEFTNSFPRANFYLDTEDFPFIPGGAQSGGKWELTLLPNWGENIYKVHYKISIAYGGPTYISPSNSYRVDGFIEVGSWNGIGWDGYEGGISPTFNFRVSSVQNLIEGTLQPIKYPQSLGLKFAMTNYPRLLFLDGKQIIITPAENTIRLLYLAVEYF